MSRAVPPGRSFRRGSPVLEYWLARCEQFAVVSPRGRRVGRVESVVVDADGRARAVVVRGAWSGRRTLAAGAIDAVTPESGTVALSSGTRGHPGLQLSRPSGVLARTGVRLRPVLGRFAVGLGRLSLAAGRLAFAAGRWSAVRLRRHGPPFAARLSALAVQTAAWLRPRAKTVLRQGALALLGAVLLLAAAVRAVASLVLVYGASLTRDERRRAESP